MMHKAAFPSRNMFVVLELLLCLSGRASAASYSPGGHPETSRSTVSDTIKSSASPASDQVLSGDLLVENRQPDEPGTVDARVLLANSSMSSGNSSFEVVAYPFFNKIYKGNGVDHMNINLVGLNQTGLAVGDEIGIFDGVYCVGDAILSADDWDDNTISIPASANDTIESQPNGFIEGHTISLKLYRTGTVYILFFQTVNHSSNIFERNGTMFALVDFSQSVDQPSLNQEETVKLYPNPFQNQLIIQINIPKKILLDLKIYDQKGDLVRTLYHAEESGQLTLKWDGKDNRGNDVPSGTYFCKINGNTTKILYQHNK
jgi:hypothetical protein